jgi:hypothetical protein
MGHMIPLVLSHQFSVKKPSLALHHLTIDHEPSFQIMPPKKI